MTSRSLGERSDVNPLYVIQARMGSTRLPGKVLADLGGEPLLSFMLRRLSPLGLDNIVVATTLESRDDLVAEAWPTLPEVTSSVDPKPMSSLALVSHSIDSPPRPLFA